MSRDDEISQMVVEAIDALMEKLPDHADRAEAAGVLLAAAYMMLRSAQGDEFVLGWLESAIEDVKGKSSGLIILGAH